MSNTIENLLAVADMGVSWKGRKHGAACPICKVRMKVISTQDKIRYCNCKNETCIMYFLESTIKAIL